MSFLGFMTELDEFNFGTGTGSYGSCSFVQSGIMYIIGRDVRVQTNSPRFFKKRGKFFFARARYL